jgi:hypothetical protein
MDVETTLCGRARAATPTMTDDSQLDFSLPSVSRKKATAAFDGGRLSGDNGVTSGRRWSQAHFGERRWREWRI